MKICFVHKQNGTFLGLAVEQAQSIGFDVVIIGDQSVNIPGVEFVDISEFENEMAEFRKIYKHVSVNPASYEIFCYERWYAVRAYMRRNNEELLIIDHDIMLYPRIFEAIQDVKEVNTARPIITDSAWCMYLPNLDSAYRLTDEFERVFNAPYLLEYVSKKYSIGGVSHISDMIVLLAASESLPSAYQQWAMDPLGYGIDNNMRITNELHIENEHKKITWSEGRPFVTKLNGDKIEMAVLHFQGPSKFLMGYYHTIPGRPDGNKHDEGALSLPDDEIHRCVTRHYKNLRDNPINKI